MALASDPLPTQAMSFTVGTAVPVQVDGVDQSPELHHETIARRASVRSQRSG